MSHNKQHVIVFCLENQIIADQIAKDFAKSGLQLEKRGFLESSGLRTLQQASPQPNGNILLLITDNFLKSAGCMYGSLPALKEWADSGKLIPIVTDGRQRKPDGGWEVLPTSFERVSNIIQYMNYWQDQYLELRKEKRHNEMDASIDQQLEITKAVSSEIGEFLRYLRNLNWYPLDRFKADHYKVFRQLSGFPALLGDENKSVPESNTTPPDAPEPGIEKERTLAEIIQESGDELIAENAELRTPSGDTPPVESGTGLLAESPIAPAEVSPPSTPAKDVDDIESLLEEALQEGDEEEEPVFVGEDPDAPEDFDLDSLFEDEQPPQMEQTEAERLEEAEIEEEEEVLLDLVSDDEEGLILNADGSSHTTPEEVLDHAVDLFENGEQQEGLQYLKKTVELNPDDNSLRYYYAYALARYQHDFKSSTTQLETILAKDREHADSWFLLAEIAENEGDYLEAKHYFEKVAQIEPDYPEVNYRLGLLTLQHFEGQQIMAAEYFKYAVEQDKKNVNAHYILATLLHEQLDDPQKAIKHFKKTLKYQPDHPFANYDLALLYHKLGERALASHYYERATELNPELKTPRNDEAFRFDPGAMAGMEKTETEAATGEFLSEGSEVAVTGEEVTDTAAEVAAMEAALPDMAELTAEVDPESDILEEKETVFPESETTETEPGTETLEEMAGDFVEETGESHLDETLKTATAVAGVTSVAGAVSLVEEVPVEITTQEEEEEEETEEEGILTSVHIPPVTTKTVLVSGATSGIGKATAELFAHNGYRVIITGRRTDRLEQMEQDLKTKYNNDVLTLNFDVRDVNAVKSVIENLPDEWKEIDILINNAGLSRGLAPIHEGDIEHWETMIDTNIKGLLYLTRAIVPHMVKRRNGHIINVASSAGKEVYPGGNVYSATKFAVDALTQSMRLDLYQHNIRVSQVAPGHVEETEFARVRFDGDTERAARVYENFQPLKSSDVAEVIYFIATRPPHVNIQDVLMFGTQQAGSNFIDRSGRVGE